MKYQHKVSLETVKVKRFIHSCLFPVEMKSLGAKLKNHSFRKYYSRYAGKIGQVSLAVGGSSLEKRLKGDGTRFEGGERDLI